MESFIITGGKPLNGEVIPSGNKNAALPLLTACILTDEPVILHNIPLIGDVLTMRLLLESLGVEITETEPHSWQIRARDIRMADLNPEHCRRIRASILLAGPMLGRYGEIELPPPGGDVIGREESIPISRPGSHGRRDYLQRTGVQYACAKGAARC